MFDSVSYAKEYYKQHRTEIIAKQLEYHRENREKYLAYMRDYNRQYYLKHHVPKPKKVKEPKQPKQPKQPKPPKEKRQKKEETFYVPQVKYPTRYETGNFILDFS